MASDGKNIDEIYDRMREVAREEAARIQVVDHWGTVHSASGNTAEVVVDGGEGTTPCTTVSELKRGDRVLVNIDPTSRKATVKGNATDLSAGVQSVEDANDRIDELSESTGTRLTAAEAAAEAAQATAEAAKEAAGQAQAAANATGQYFFHDSNGAHVTTTPDTATGAFNAVWNTAGLLFRKLSNNLVSLTESALSFFDGEGNDGSNVVAMFGKRLARVGRSDNAHVVMSSDGYVDVNYGSTNMAHFGYAAGNDNSGSTSTAPFYTLGQRMPGSAIGNYSVAEGNYPTASGFASHSEGSMTTASGTDSHAEGMGTTASGMASHAEGSSTLASAVGAHAEGFGCQALGQCSHAEGESTIAASVSQHVSGRYNVVDASGSYAEIVGGGSVMTARKNIRTLDWSGNAVFAGKVTDGSGNVLSSKANTNDVWLTTTSRTANTVLAAPNGSTGSATFRKLVAADVPSLPASKIGSGTFDDARVPNLNASKITAGRLDPLRMPSWTSVATTTHETKATFDLSSYNEVCVVCRYSTTYLGSIVLPKAALHATTEREVYLTGANNSTKASDYLGRGVAAKMTRSSITPVACLIDGVSRSGSWTVYAR